MKIYHHSKYENLEKIITKEGLSFRGSFYKEFNATDYKWTQRVVSRIIKRICKQRKVIYEEDSNFKPIIISFGLDSASDYMWTKYAQEYNGIQLILDSDIIAQVAYSNFDYFARCHYMRKRGRMKKFIEQMTYPIECINDIQTNLESVSALIKPLRFKRENEIRYIRDYSKLVELNYESFMKIGDRSFVDCFPSYDDCERYVCFPKEALIGVTIGYKSSEKLDVVKNILENCNYNLSNILVRIYPQNEI